MFVIVNKRRFSAVIIIALAIVAAIAVKTPVMRCIYPQKYSGFVEKSAAKYGVDKLLVYSVIKAESGFNEKAESKSGAKGLMQLMDETADWIFQKSDIPPGDIFSPETNIELGTWYLSYLSSKNDDLLTVLASYNAGSTNVERWRSDAEVDKIELENIQFAETKEYVQRILKYYGKYQKIYGGK